MQQKGQNGRRAAGEALTMKSTFPRQGDPLAALAGAILQLAWEHLECGVLNVWCLTSCISCFQVLSSRLAPHKKSHENLQGS